METLDGQQNRRKNPTIPNALLMALEIILHITDALLMTLEKWMIIHDAMKGASREKIFIV